MIDLRSGCACDTCHVSGRQPEKCPMSKGHAAILDGALETCRDDGFTHAVMAAHSRLLGRGSSRWERIEHIREFCVQMGVKTIGLAICSMFLKEAKAVSVYFEDKGFRCVTVCCKVGNLQLEDVGIDVHLDNAYPLCNSVGQAAVLNAYETDINVLLGLCAPHDMLLGWHAKAPCTTLFAKEHVTQHAPFSSVAKMVREDVK